MAQKDTCWNCGGDNYHCGAVTERCDDCGIFKNHHTGQCNDLYREAEERAKKESA